MEKIKLIEARKHKNYSQEYIAKKLNINESNYSRREKGLTKITLEEWIKLAQILEIAMEDIYEPDENPIFICNNHAPGNYGNNNNIISVPESIIETYQKYIQKLEEENKTLKELLKKYENK